MRPGGVETNVREVSRRLLAAPATTSTSSRATSTTRRVGSGGADYAPVVDGVPVRRFSVRKY